MDAFDLNLVDRRSTQHRQRKGVASRVANAVMESRRHDGGHTQVDYASARGSENERPRAGTRSSLRAIAAFLATFLMLMWAIPAPRSSLGAADSANRSTELGKPRMSREVSREDPMKNPVFTTFAASAAMAVASAASADNHVLKLTAGGDAAVIAHHASQNPGSAITIEYWMKWSGSASNGGNVRYGRPVSKRSGSSGAYSVTWFDLNYCDGELFLVGQVSPGIQLSTQWSHHAVTWSADSREIRFYLNGSLVKTAPFLPTSLAVSSDQLRFGNTSGFESATQFKGMLDDIRIWSVERSATEIAQTMCVSIGAKEASQYQGLIGSWTFENGVTDATGVNNGSLVGAAAIVAENVCALPCPGDIDDSGFADAIDLAIVLANWGTPSPKYPAADANLDGEVNGTDLAMVLSSWGACP
jgi:hypothetical protein